MNNHYFSLKFIVCIVFNIALFSSLFIGYKYVNRKKEMIKNQKPITVKILDVLYSAKSSNKCKVQYKNTIYEAKLPYRNIKKGSVNRTNFYYDTQNDVVFSSNIGVPALNVIGVLFFISLLLWFIPKEKFTW